MAILKRSKTQISGLQNDLDTIYQDLSIYNNNFNTQVNDLQLAISSNREVLEAADLALDGRVSTVEATVANINVTADVATAIGQEVVDRDAAIAAAISAAQLNIGNDYTVVDIAARDALTGLLVNDRVLVEDDGDTKWAVYQVTAVVEGPTFLKIIDQDALTNAISASSIKQAYESNSDTNAFTDADATKVAHISVTQAIDLDAVLLESVVDADGTFTTADNLHLPTSAAVKTYVDAQVAAVESNITNLQVITETLGINSGRIRLQYVPAVILNFGTVRHVDVNNVAYDIQVQVDPMSMDNKDYFVMTDTPGQFNNESVTIQYVK